jgi:hypothetical protein
MEALDGAIDIKERFIDIIHRIWLMELSRGMYSSLFSSPQAPVSLTPDTASALIRCYAQ